MAHLNVSRNLSKNDTDGSKGVVVLASVLVVVCLVCVAAVVVALTGFLAAKRVMASKRSQRRDRPEQGSYVPISTSHS